MELKIRSGKSMISAPMVFGQLAPCVSLWMLSIGLAGASVPVEKSGSLDVATRGQAAAYAIVTAADPSPSVRYAAEELRDFIVRSTGVTLPVTTVRGAARAIFVGPGAGPESDALGRDLGSDGFRLVAKAPHIYICGAATRGALYGVYSFLERFANCGFYASWHTVVPELDHISVPCGFDVVERPAFKMREAFWWDVMGHPEFAARIRLNTRSFQENDTEAKFGGSALRISKGLPLCHTFKTLLPNEEFFAEHPEYFSFVEGKRISGRNQLCLTNPDVLRIVTERVKEQIRKEPGCNCFGVSQNDWNFYCCCPRCKAVDDEEGGQAGTIIRFVNAVAAEVEREFPHVIIQTLAYQYSRTPPKKVRPRKNVAVCLCSIECDFARPLDQSPDDQNVKFCRDIEGWSRICDRLFVWDYTTDFYYYTSPFANVKSLQGNIRLFRGNNVEFVFEQGACQGRHADFAELKAWLLAKWLWNPDIPEKDLLDRFFPGYYGAGAPFIREYYEELHRLQHDHRMGCYLPVTENPALSDDFLWRAKEMWRKAELAVAGDPACSYNVRMGAFSVDWALVERLPEYDPRVPALVRSLLKRMEEAGDIRTHESAWSENARMEKLHRLLGEDIDPIVALAADSTMVWPDDLKSIETMRRMRHAYGIRRFVIGKPFDASKKSLRRDDVEFYWWARDDVNGGITVAGVRTLAGKSRPIFVIHGARHCGENRPDDLPKVLEHAVNSVRHLPKDVDKVYAAEAFPHARSSNSVMFCESEIAAGLMAGADDLLLLGIRMEDDPLCDSACLDMLKKNRRRFTMVRNFRRHSSLVVLPKPLGGSAGEVATRSSGIWLSAAVSDDGKELLVMANNLSGEPRSDVALEFSKKWCGGKVDKLAMDGIWQPVGAASEAFWGESMKWPAMTPEFFKVTKE